MPNRELPGHLGHPLENSRLFPRGPFSLIVKTGYDIFHKLSEFKKRFTIAGVYGYCLISRKENIHAFENPNVRRLGLAQFFDPTIEIKSSVRPLRIPNHDDMFHVLVGTINIKEDYRSGTKVVIVTQLDGTMHRIDPLYLNCSFLLTDSFEDLLESTPTCDLPIELFDRDKASRGLMLRTVFSDALDLHSGTKPRAQSRYVPNEQYGEEVVNQPNRKSSGQIPFFQNQLFYDYFANVPQQVLETLKRHFEAGWATAPEFMSYTAYIKAELGDQYLCLLFDPGIVQYFDDFKTFINKIKGRVPRSKRFHGDVSMSPRPTQVGNTIPRHATLRELFSQELIRIYRTKTVYRSMILGVQDLQRIRDYGIVSPALLDSMPSAIQALNAVFTPFRELRADDSIPGKLVHDQSYTDAIMARLSDLLFSKSILMSVSDHPDLAIAAAAGGGRIDPRKTLRSKASSQQDSLNSLQNSPQANHNTTH